MSSKGTATSINIVLNSAIRGSSFLQASVQKVHTYSHKVSKANLLGATKFPLLNRNVKSLSSHLGHIRSTTAKISANPIRLDIKTSRNSLKEARKDMTAIQHEAKQFAFFTKKANENLNKPVREWNYKQVKQNTPLANVRNGISNKVRVGGAIATGSVIAGLSSLNPIQKAIDFETNMADVTKATNANKKQTLFLKDNILKLVSQGSLLEPSQIAQIQAGGGRSGVGINSLPRFTKDISMASVAMDLSTEESGRQFAKMAERLNLPIGKINILTNAFTHLENNGANSARDMINTTGRLAGIFKELDFQPKNGAALSNYMNTLEVSPELAATSFKILTNRLKKTNSEFGYFDRLKREGAGGLKGIISDITSRMSSEQIIRKFGSQGSNVITKMKGDFKNLDKSLKLVSSNGFMSAVKNEYKVKLGTTGAKETMARNKTSVAMIVAGDELKKPYLDLYEGVSKAITSTVLFYKENRELIHTVGKASLYIGGLVLAVKGVAMVSTTVMQVATAFKFLNLVVRANPIIALVTGIATAGYLVYKNWDFLKSSASKIWADISNKIKSPFVSMFNWLDEKFKNVLDIKNKVTGFFGIGSDDTKEDTKKVNLVNGLKENNTGLWNKTKSLFSWGGDAKENTLQKPQLLKNVSVNNSLYKTTFTNSSLTEIPAKQITLESPSKLSEIAMQEQKTQMQLQAM